LEGPLCQREVAERLVAFERQQRSAGGGFFERGELGVAAVVARARDDGASEGEVLAGGGRSGFGEGEAGKGKVGIGLVEAEARAGREGEGGVEIGPGGRLMGTVETHSLVVKEGGCLDGDCRIAPARTPLRVVQPVPATSA